MNLSNLLYSFLKEIQVICGRLGFIFARPPDITAETETIVSLARPFVIGLPSF